MVKSNSLRATKSMASEAASEGPGETATCAPTMPMRSFGLAALKASTTFTSEGKEGVEVWSTRSSTSAASGSTSSSESPRAGASMSRLPGTKAAGWASQVGYQKERISRLAW